MLVSSTLFYIDFTTYLWFIRRTIASMGTYTSGNKSSHTWGYLVTSNKYMYMLCTCMHRHVMQTPKYTLHSKGHLYIYMYIHVYICRYMCCSARLDSMSPTRENAVLSGYLLAIPRLMLSYLGTAMDLVKADTIPQYLHM